MKFAQYQKGKKHHFLLKGNKKFIRDVLEIIGEYDSKAKLIPGRFRRVNSSTSFLSVVVNSQQNKEILINRKHNGWCQYFKIKCRDEIIAHYILLEMRGWN